LAGPVDPDVLEEVMLAREQIEDAAREEDLEVVRANNERRIEAVEKQLERVFHQGDVDAAVRLVVALRYWVNVRESVKAWEEGKGVPALQH
jgi:molecular chaperone HscB